MSDLLLLGFWICVALFILAGSLWLAHGLRLAKQSKVVLLVTEFGAKGDGVTDDTVAIQRAHAAAAAFEAAGHGQG